MRRALLLVVASVLLASSVLATSAYNYASLANGSGTGRPITVNVVGDDVAYLAINGYGAHKCFVSIAANGKATVSFAQTGATCTGNGGGTGINAGDGSTSTKYARYAFHDILKISNHGTKNLNVYVNASTTSASSSHMDVAKKASAGQMSDADYYDTSLTTLPLTVGSDLFVGIRVKSGTLTSGSVTGTITIAAIR